MFSNNSPFNTYFDFNLRVYYVKLERQQGTDLEVVVRRRRPCRRTIVE